MELGNLIARGRTADLYELPENRVLKLFYDWVSPEAINKEYEVSRRVFQARLPVPQVFEVVDLESHTGIIYEKIQGTTMLSMLAKKPWQVAQHSRVMAELHHMIHQVKVDESSTYHDQWFRNIERVPDLSEEVKQKLIAQVKQLPNDNCLCHFDFHPDQVIYTEKGPIILDWLTAEIGHPAADVARTQILITIGKPPDASIGMQLLAILLGKVANFYYQQHYLALNPSLNREIIQRWLAPLAAVRLLEKVPGEEPALMKIIQKFMNA